MPITQISFAFVKVVFKMNQTNFFFIKEICYFLPIKLHFIKMDLVSNSFINFQIFFFLTYQAQNHFHNCPKISKTQRSNFLFRQSPQHQAFPAQISMI